MTERSSRDDNDRSLSIRDAINLILAIVIGSGIYFTPPLILRLSGSGGSALLLWLCGGLLSMLGALCYAELTTTYPRSGGEYNYLTRAYGPVGGFLFSWVQLLIVQTGSLGALSWIFATNLRLLLPQGTLPGTADQQTAGIALGAILGLTALQLIGLRAGTTVQTILVSLKIAGLTALIVAGLAWGREPVLGVPDGLQGHNWGVALLLVMYTYGGWSDSAFVVAEIDRPTRNVPKALFLGLGLVMSLYLLINIAYLRGLGPTAFLNSKTPAGDVLQLLTGRFGSTLMTVLVAISALSGVNSLIFAASRVHAAVGREHRLLAPLGYWASPHVPAVSLAVQATVTSLMIVLFGTAWGNSLINAAAGRAGFGPIPFEKYDGGFNTLFAASAPAFWTSLMLTGLSVLVLRQVDPERERPFRVPLFPLIPCLFVSVCAYLLYLSVDYASSLLLPLLPILVTGLLLSQISGYRPAARD